MKIPRITIVWLFALLAISQSRAAEANSASAILAELERSFSESFVPAWYPRAIDAEKGGYRSDFDADWDANGPQDKFIVSQARHVWMTSQLAQFTEEKRFGEYAKHGYEFLRDVMWDEEFGGFHSLVSRDGNPQTGQGKSAYGTSFAIYALSSYYESSGDPEALELAKQTFRWLERNSWDREYGGYVDRLNDDGSWRGESEATDFENPSSHVGLKDFNSSIHLLEALTALYQVWDDALVRDRLTQMLELIRDRFTTEKGYLRLYFFRDWTPVSHRGRSRSFVESHWRYDHVSWGHDVETAFLLLEASHALGREFDERTLAVAKRMVDHALATGWDERLGGLREAGYYFEEDGACEVIRSEKVWWVEAECLNALLLMLQLFPDEPRYAAAFQAQWEYIKSYLIDHENGGWYPSGLDTNPDADERAKSYIWKTSYHDGRAYMNCIKMLRGDFPLTRRSHAQFESAR